MDPLHYLLNDEQISSENDKINDAYEKSDQKVSDEKVTVEPLIDFSTAHENAKKTILEEPMIESQNEMLERIGVILREPLVSIIHSFNDFNLLGPFRGNLMIQISLRKNIFATKPHQRLLAENAELKNRQSVIQEKYQRVCERFHYVEGKIQRRDDARMITEKTILSTLEKLQLGLEKLDSRITDEKHKLEESLVVKEKEDSMFRESMKRYFQVRV